MTCRQVRQLLAAYRRDDCSPAEHAELEAHLRECAECRARDAEFRRVGESIRSLPPIAPPPEFFARVMAAVQAEEARAQEQPKPAEKKQEKVVVPGLTNVSHFPTLRRAVAERRVRLEPMRRATSPTMAFAMRYGAALAATFLIFAFGLSLALFQFLGGQTGVPPSGGPPPACINAPCTPLVTSVFAPDPMYPLVGDATASPDGQYVVYAAHTPRGDWMLEALSRRTGKSMALLPEPVAGPLTLGGWARSWVLWVQGTPSAAHHWQLNATELAPALPGAAQTLQLLQGGESGADGRVMALHGMYASGGVVLLAEQLADGRGQLVRIDLDQAGTASRSIIAKAQPGHLITNPTTDGTADYWADQWLASDGTPHSNIVRLGVGSASEPLAITHNDASFAPMVVAGKLIWLEALRPQDIQAAAKTATPTVSPTPRATLTPGGGSASNAPVAGVLWSAKLDDRTGLIDLDSAATRARISDAGSAVMPQAGATFVVWQDGGGNFYLYDVVKGGSAVQPLTSTISNPLVLSVSPTAVLWVTADAQGNSQTPAKTSINLLDWPQPKQ